MGRFDGILICTDLDGTLLKNDSTISDENVAAIEYFKQEGGCFTFVTGRMPFFVSDIYNRIKPNAPFGCVNGGGLFDHVAQKYIWTAEMSDEVLELVTLIDERFPKIAIQVNTFEHTYFCTENHIMQWFRQKTGLPNLVKGYREIDEPIAKIVLGGEDDDGLLEMEAVLKTHPVFEKFDFIRSEKNFFEILPKGIEKGVSIVKLADFLNIDIQKTIAIGDYNNDISMMRAAGIGIAVENACREAKEAADFVTVSNEEHAIAKVIEDLENGKYSVC